MVSPLTVDRMREITEIRSVMETQANMWAMNRITPEGMANLAKVRDEINRLKADATITHVKISLDKIMGLS